VLKPQIKKKAKIVQDIQEKVGKAQIGILADFTGLKVEAMTLLRRQVKEAGGELTVTKNTLLRRAAEEGTLIAPVRGELTGPNALVLGYEDPVALAKLLVKFAQDKPFLKIKGGVIGEQTLSATDVDALSKLPAREVLLAQFLGVLQGVPQALVTVLSGVLRNFLNALVAIRDQKGGGEAPGETAEGGEAPGEKAEGGEAPGEKAEGGEVPGEKAEGDEVPGEKAEGDEVPGEKAEGDEA